MGLFDWLKGKPKSTPQPESAPASASQSWRAGDRVLAKWMDAFFYPGRIQQVQGPKCLVHFDDGDVSWVHAAHMLAPDIAVGSQVFGRVRGGPSYYPGTVRQQKGEKIQIRYDHGEEEWTTISMVRVQRPIANVGPEEAAPYPPPPGPPAPVIDLGEPTQDSNWRVGDRVLARWMDFYWYPGTILGMGTKGFHILYDDGDQRVVQEIGLTPLVIEDGEQLFIRPKTEPQRTYSPAVVTRVDGETIDVEYEDGHRETNTRVSRARFWRCPVRFHALPFEEGDRVLAFDADDCIYPAEIVSIQDDRIVVQYLDGPERMLTPELIKRFDLRAGARIEGRWKGGPNYFPGVLAKLEGDRVFVRYDDGDEEWTSVRLIRVPKASPTS